MAKATKPAEAKAPEQEAKATKPATARFVVISPFKDAPEYIEEGEAKNYEVGDDVSHFDELRIANLVRVGNVKEQ